MGGGYRRRLLATRGAWSQTVATRSAWSRTVATRSAWSQTVAARFRSVLGSEVGQDELLTLRRGLMGSLFSPPNKEEKGSNTVMLASWEAKKHEVLAILDGPEAIREVLRVADELRVEQREQRQLWGHVLQVE
jgi:hypothetical protein